jgi:hypothetical protein
MNRLDIVACKVVRVKRQNAADAVDVHCRHKPGVVDLASQDAVSEHETFPLAVDRGRVRQNRKEPLDFFEFSQGERDGEAQAVIGHGPRGDIPELGDILQREIHRLAGGQELGDAFDGYRVAWMIGLSSPQQDIGVGQDAHLPVAAVDALAAYGVVGQRRRVRKAAR